MLRRAFGLMTALSLVLCAATIVVWVRSDTVADDPNACPECGTGPLIIRAKA